ncbi:MAG TPA: hypothetical protein VGB73_11380 [Pyrinomonadaceae bacterium]|jgi:hypothetical protein
MECGKCLQLLSELIDGTLDTENGTHLSTHLERCLSCVCVRRDLEFIVRLARELREEFAHLAPCELKIDLFTGDFQRAAVR